MRLLSVRFPAPSGRFQSTHSLRSATSWDFTPASTHKVSIHALLAECDFLLVRAHLQIKGFNPRTPCGVRLKSVHQSGVLAQFQSTHSLRSATGVCRFRIGEKAVSIHALLAECDFRAIYRHPIVKSFNPRTPCGVRPSCPGARNGFSTFQSTHSLRSATV